MADQASAAQEASVASSPSKKKMKSTHEVSERAAVGTIFQMRTEIPAVPNTAVAAFATTETDDKSAGNFDYTTELLEKGHTGFWRRRQDTCFDPTPIEIDVHAYFAGIENTLTGILNRLFQLKTQLPGETVVNRVANTASILACGCCLMTYLKVRNLVTSELPARHFSMSLKRPRVKDALAVPTGFAFAIQQLGIVNVADTLTERIYIPCFPNVGHTTGIPDDQLLNWNPNAYAQAVEYARTLGLQFSVVDLKKKDGSAWWLFRQTYDEDVFELQCTLPEVNFTKAMAVTHALFLDGNNVNPLRTFVNLQALGNANFGIMMRNPHLGVHLSCYEAISQEANEVVSNV